MAKLEVKDGVYGAAIVILITIMGIQLLNVDGWYYCEIENTMKECSELRSYGIPDAKCIGIDGVNDICTSGGTRAPWKPLDNYINITPDKEVVVESLQECHIEYYDKSVAVYETCNQSVYNYKDCIETHKNGTCINWSTYDIEYPCYNRTEIQEKNWTICEPIGFNIIFGGKKEYNITGDCCGYFNETQQIMCKEKINGICNPKCQQSSLDPDEYDEYCMIYQINEKDITPSMVGEYDYVKNNQIKLSDITMEKIK